MRRLLFLAPLIVLVVLAAGFAVALFSGYNPRVLPSALIDRPAPSFDLPALQGIAGDGQTVPDLTVPDLTAADLTPHGATGRPVLVNFFASWCTPCLAEHPVMTRLSHELGFTVYGIAYKDDPEDTLAWLRRNGDPFDRVGLDQEGRTAVDWGVSGVPETFVIGPEGRVRFRYAGPITPQVLDETLMPVLEEIGGS